MLVDYYHVEEHRLFFKQLKRSHFKNLTWKLHKGQNEANKVIKDYGLIKKCRNFYIKNFVTIIFELQEILFCRETVFGGSSLLLLYFTPFLSRRTSIILHGELSLIERKSISCRILKLSLQNSRASLLVIAEHIQKHSSEQKINCKLLQLKTTHHLESIKNIRTIGLVGTIDIRKYNKDTLKHLETVRHLKLIIAGRTDRESSIKLNLPYQPWLEQNKFQDLLTRIDIAFFPYNEYYKFIRSGAIDECLEYGIPVVTTCNYLKPTYGDTIYYLNEKETLNDFVKRF